MDKLSTANKGLEAKEILLPSNIIVSRRGSIFSSKHNIPHDTNFKEPLLNTIDILISIFIVTPLVVVCWRGLWKFMDAQSQYFPIWESFTLGVSIHIFLAVVQDYLHDVIIVRKEKSFGMKLITYVCMKLYTYIFITITTLHWRGAWTALDMYTGVQYADDGRKAIKEGSFYGLLIPGACFCILCLMRCLRNATAPPFAICLDTGDSMFLFPTKFKVEVKKNKFLRILDCSFSVFVVGNLVVIFWRGVWIVCDIVLIPSDITLSSWASLIIGYLMVAIIFRLQNPMKQLCAQQKGVIKIVLADFYIVLSIVSTLNVWRGIWNLLDTYLQIGTPECSSLTSHYISFICLVLMNCSNSCLVRGVYKDAEEPGGESVVFPCQFLRIILQEEKVTLHSKIPLADVTEELAEVRSSNCNGTQLEAAKLQIT